MSESVRRLADYINSLEVPEAAEQVAALRKTAKELEELGIPLFVPKDVPLYAPEELKLSPLEIQKRLVFAFSDALQSDDVPVKFGLSNELAVAINTALGSSLDDSVRLEHLTLPTGEYKVIDYSLPEDVSLALYRIDPKIRSNYNLTIKLLATRGETLGDFRKGEQSVFRNKRNIGESRYNFVRDAFRRNR